ncbi:DDE_superfamily endonuclease domain-containing protein [Hexamita inflata]|uniref:DDE superfamily endonuclease domain-containing protein n=1 Tax=Hexamita inflata TaxID=28002 RepID=A0AA86R0H5_9EUKA|nr:DDE superfamily endonuclease domain-containing protein [Hexamita inflata]
MTIYNLGWHHPHWTLSQISQQIFEQCQVKLTRPTISYTLAEWGYKFYKQTVIQALTEERKKKRLAFCELYKDFTEADWAQVMFADESIFREMASGIDYILRR